MTSDDFEEFLEWYTSLNPADKIDIHEAWTIFLNFETYGEIV